MLFRFSTPLLISCSLHLRRFVKISNYWYAYISPCVTSNSFSFFKIVVELSLLKHFSQNSLFLDNYNCNPCLCLKKKILACFCFCHLFVAFLIFLISDVFRLHGILLDFVSLLNVKIIFL